MPIYAPLAVWPYYFAPYVSRNPLLHPFLHTLCSEKSTSIRPKSLLRLVCNDLAGRPYGFQHVRGRVFPAQDPGVALFGGMRSEEHTSELQSRFDLVCRLLLEKKKILYKQ